MSHPGHLLIGLTPLQRCSRYILLPKPIWLDYMNKKYEEKKKEKKVELDVNLAKNLTA